MIGYLARRFGQAALILLGISLVTFVLLYLLPADPVRQIAGRSATAETVKNIRRQPGLNPNQKRWRRPEGLPAGPIGEVPAR